jgi:hypothetical protein
MDELITKVCTKLNVDEDVAKQAIGAILIFLKEQVDLYGGKGEFDFSRITDKLKGAIPLMNDAPKTAAEAKKEHQENHPEGETFTTSQSLFQSVVAVIQYILTVGPIFDLLKKMLSTFFGEGAVQMLESSKDSADMMAILSNLGISHETAKHMMTLLVSFLNEKVGPETVEKLSECVPALQPFLETTKKEE